MGLCSVDPGVFRGIEGIAASESRLRAQQLGGPLGGWGFLYSLMPRD